MTLQEAYEESKKRARVLAIIEAAGEHRTKPYLFDMTSECLMRCNDGYQAPSFLLEADKELGATYSKLGRN